MSRLKLRPPEIVGMGECLVQFAALDEAAFRAAGIPDTPTNRAACRGHSRAWMRLYRLRLDRPDYADCGDAVEAIPLKRRG